MSSTAITIPRADRELWLRIGWVLLFLGALMAAGNAFLFTALSEFKSDYGGSAEADLNATIQKARMFAIPIIGYAHTVGGLIAALIGPFQFVGAIRRRAPSLHRWMGRAYLASVGLSGLSGLYLAPGSFASNTYGIAFVALALAWLYTGSMAFLTIRRGEVAQHKRWMVRNYALTYAAVTLRVQMPFFIALVGLTPVMALNIVGWTCWVPSLIVVEWWMRRRRQPAVVTA
jgi:uncharacterized membrane protein